MGIYEDGDRLFSLYGNPDTQIKSPSYPLTDTFVSPETIFIPPATGRNYSFMLAEPVDVYCDASMAGHGPSDVEFAQIKQPGVHGVTIVADKATRGPQYYDIKYQISANRIQDLLAVKTYLERLFFPAGDGKIVLSEKVGVRGYVDPGTGQAVKSWETLYANAYTMSEDVSEYWGNGTCQTITFKTIIPSGKWESAGGPNAYVPSMTMAAQETAYGTNRIFHPAPQDEMTFNLVLNAANVHVIIQSFNDPNSWIEFKALGLQSVENISIHLPSGVATGTGTGVSDQNLSGCLDYGPGRRLYIYDGLLDLIKQQGVQKLRVVYKRAWY